MEFTIYKETTFWRDARFKRSLGFIRVLAWVMVLLSLNWMMLTIREQLYMLTWATGVNAVMGGVILWLLKKKHLARAKLLLVITAGCYYFIAAAFASGYGIDDGSAHFGFFFLAVASSYLLHDHKPWNVLFASLFLVLFFAYHFGYAPFHPLVHLTEDRLFWVHRIDISTTLFLTLFTTLHFVREITRSEEALVHTADKLEGLVQSMLPPDVADRLRKDGKTFADEFHDCSVLFADIAGFTAWSSSRSPTELVERLNDIFTRFDDAVERAGLTKIKTIGDSYMVAAGIPNYMDDHAVRLTRLALELQSISSSYSHFRFRVGINSGSVVAGIIGKKIFLYDIWGDTVNTASRLENCSEVGRINVSHSTYMLIRESFTCTPRGALSVKDKGDMDMYFVEREGR